MSEKRADYPLAARGKKFLRAAFLLRCAGIPEVITHGFILGNEERLLFDAGFRYNTTVPGKESNYEGSEQ